MRACTIILAPMAMHQKFLDWNSFVVWKNFFGTPWSYYDNELENFKIAFFGDESISILWSANLVYILSDLMIPLVKVLIFWPRKKF